MHIANRNPGNVWTRPLTATFCAALLCLWSGPALAVQGAGGGEADGPPWTASLEGTERIRLVADGDGNEARYFVREQLARINFPSDAIGATSDVTGTLVLDADGNVVAEESRFEVDLRTLRTDSDRRDNFVRRNVLGTEQNPLAVFLPTAINGLDGSLPGSEPAELQMVGDMTINGVTRPVTWDLVAEATEDSLRGTATIQFSFDLFEMEIPSVGSVLSVEDDIRLVLDFNLVPEVLEPAS